MTGLKPLRLVDGPAELHKALTAKDVNILPSLAEDLFEACTDHALAGVILTLEFYYEQQGDPETTLRRLESLLCADQMDRFRIAITELGYDVTDMSDEGLWSCYSVALRLLINHPEVLADYYWKYEKAWS
jgi:hypothetical protein